NGHLRGASPGDRGPVPLRTPPDVSRDRPVPRRRIARARKPAPARRHARVCRAAHCGPHRRRGSRPGARVRRRVRVVPAARANAAPLPRVTRSPARLALVEGWPVLVTSVVVGTTYGVVARQSGLSLVEASASSLLVFAGAAQFAALELLKGGASAPEVALAILLINARHLLMAAAIRPFVSRAPLATRLGLGYVLTD